MSCACPRSWDGLCFSPAQINPLVEPQRHFPTFPTFRFDCFLQWPFHPTSGEPYYSCHRGHFPDDFSFFSPSDFSCLYHGLKRRRHSEGLVTEISSPRKGTKRTLWCLTDSDLSLLPPFLASSPSLSGRPFLFSRSLTSRDFSDVLRNVCLTPKCGIATRNVPLFQPRSPPYVSLLVNQNPYPALKGVIFSKGDFPSCWSYYIPLSCISFLGRLSQK